LRRTIALAPKINERWASQSERIARDEALKPRKVSRLVDDEIAVLQ
jgi:hypothetical protein